MRPASARLRRLGPGQSRLGFGSGLSCPHAATPASLGSPGQAPGARVQFGWGGRCPQKKAGLRPRPRRHKARGRGAVAPVAGLAARSQCMQVLPP